MSSLLRQLFAAIALLVALPVAANLSAAERDAVLSVWRLLDYVGIDYAEAVRDGRVINNGEYAEMVEFADVVQARLPELPENDAKARLTAGAAALRAAIDARSDPETVAAMAGDLARALLAAYPVPLAPAAAPDMGSTPALYAEHCAACHGTTGHGDGAAAAAMDPPPVDFHDAARQRGRSVFALYGIIANGVEGTAMTAYPHLDDAQRWALAFYVGQLLYTDAQRKEGEQLWREQAGAGVPSLAALTEVTPAQLADRFGAEKGAALAAYLRAHPDAVGQPAGDVLADARSFLARSAQAYARGDTRGATDLALKAYLEGFEPVEPAVATRDAALVRKIEAAMLDYRALLQRPGQAAAVQARVADLDALLERAGASMDGGQASAAAAFASGFVILFREGLEAILVLVAIVACLRRTGRREAMPYVHAGWLGALALGVATWAAATWLIQVSGAQREMTEGVTGLVAVAVLLFVGLWMHSQSLSGRWQAYIDQAIQTHLSRNSRWGLGLLAFVAVYREVFETVLFYRALWEQGAHAALVSGIGAAAAALFVVGALLFRAGARLPLRDFFLASSALIAALAVVLAGKAASALQEAGVLSVTPWKGPTLDLLGVYPTAQTLGFQIAIMVTLLLGFWANRRLAHAAARAGDSRPA